MYLILKILKMGLDGVVPPGVVTGANLLKLMQYCRDNKVALPGLYIHSTCILFVRNQAIPSLLVSACFAQFSL